MTARSERHNGNAAFAFTPCGLAMAASRRWTGFVRAAGDAVRAHETLFWFRPVYHYQRVPAGITCDENTDAPRPPSCCARAASGHTAALPSPAMNPRRLITGSPRRL